MKRDQTVHERLIPMLVQVIGANKYLELGTHLNETISKVRCAEKYGVDKDAVNCEGAQMFRMSTIEFIEHHAEKYAPFDFVFIDADHSAAMVRADCTGIWGFVKEEGLVCLHDTNPETIPDATPGFCGDAWKVPMMMAMAGVEAVTLPYHPGLTIMRKRMRWEPVP